MHGDVREHWFTSEVDCKLHSIPNVHISAIQTKVLDFKMEIIEHVWGMLFVAWWSPCNGCMITHQWRCDGPSQLQSLNRLVHIIELHRWICSAYFSRTHAHILIQYHGQNLSQVNKWRCLTKYLCAMLQKNKSIFALSTSIVHSIIWLPHAVHVFLWSMHFGDKWSDVYVRKYCCYFALPVMDWLRWRTHRFSELQQALLACRSIVP